MRRFHWVWVLAAAGCGGPAELGGAGAELCAGAEASSEVFVCDGEPQCQDGSDEVGCRAPAQFEHLDIRRVWLDGLAEGQRVEVHHPVKLTVAIDAQTVSPGLLTLAFGLIEANAQPGAEQTPRCTLGGATLLSSQMEGERLLEIEAAVPTSCLPEGQQMLEHALWVRLDPSGEASLSDGRSATRTFVFDHARADDNQACMDAEERPGCVTQLLVEASQGIDVELQQLELGTSVAILYPQELPVHWKPYPDGSPMPQFRPPLMTVNTALAVLGADPTAENALPAPGDELVLDFALRPVEVYEDETLEPDLQWRALNVDQASRAVAVGHPEFVSLTELPAEGATIHSFDLYAEGALYELLAEGGEWANYGVFELKSCVRPSFEEHRLDTQSPEENNCQVEEFILANARTPDNAASTSVVRYGFGPWSDTWGSTSTERLRLGISFGNAASAAGMSTDNRLYAELSGWVDYDIFDASWQAQTAGLLDGSFYDANFVVFDDVLLHRDRSSSGGSLSVNTNYWPDASWTERECQSWSYYYLVTINLEGCATGRIGIDYDGSYDVRKLTQGYGGAMTSRGSIRVHVRPFADARLAVTASVDGGVVRAGVSADVTVLDVQLNDYANSSAGAGPMSTMNFSVRTSPLVYENRYLTDIDANLNVNTLAGRIWVYVDYLDAWESFWGWEREWVRWGSKTIGRWGGLDASFDVLHRASASIRQVNSRSSYNIARSRL